MTNNAKHVDQIDQIQNKGTKLANMIKQRDYFSILA